jgi:hypothetical protein
MRPGIRVLVLSSSLCGWMASAHAQESPTRRGHLYGFLGSGAIGDADYSMPTMHTGFGAEGLVYKGLGIGAELGYLSPWRSLGAGIGLLSLDGSYHFKRHRQISPFVTGGYSLGFRSGAENLINFGGGVNIWLRNRLGIRLEARDHIIPEYAGTQCLSLRIGFLFR